MVTRSRKLERATNCFTAAVVFAVQLTTVATQAFAAQGEIAKPEPLAASATNTALQMPTSPWADACARRLAAAQSRRENGVLLTEVGVAAAAAGLVMVRYWGETRGWGGFTLAISGSSIARAGSKRTSRTNEEIEILEGLPGCQPASAIVPQATAGAFRLDAITEWQAEIAQAKARGTAGRTKERIGLAILAASQAVVLSSPHTCGTSYYPSPAGPEVHRSCDGRAAAALSLIGVGVTTAVLGHHEASLAEGEARTLIARGPSGGGGTIALPTGATRALGVSLGPHAGQVTWRMAW